MKLSRPQPSNYARDILSSKAEGLLCDQRFLKGQTPQRAGKLLGG